MTISKSMCSNETNGCDLNWVIRFCINLRCHVNSNFSLRFQNIICNEKYRDSVNVHIKHPNGIKIYLSDFDCGNVVVVAKNK